MEGITFIAHGGPGSGRYPKGSGKKYSKIYKVNRKIVDTTVKVGSKTAEKMGNTGIYKKALTPTANKIADSKAIDKAINFVDKVGSTPVKHMRKKSRGFNYLYKSYFGGVKYISVKTGLSQNAVRIALM